MGFEEPFIPQFLKNFDQNKEKIRQFPGCLHLELYRDRDQSNVFFTYSYWDQPESLEKYRQSDVFQGIWKETKKGFCEKPQAWSVDRIQSLP